MPRYAKADGAVILRVGIVATLLLGALVVVTWKLDLAPGGAVGGTPLPDSGRVTVLGELGGEIRESSGVAVSRTHDGILWTHNDQSGEPTLFAIASNGSIQGRIAVEGAEAEDWEDLALGECPAFVAPAPAAGGGDCLFIGDIGDNGADRERVTIWIVPEPDPGAANSGPATRVDVRYPEGPADAEGLALAPNGDLMIVTKGDAAGARLYRIPLPETPGGPIVATLVGTLPLQASSRESRLTGAAQSPDGATLAVRTFRDVYLFPMDDPLSAPRVCPVGTAQPQGEAVAFLDDESLVLTSEARRGAAAPILRVRCP